MIEKQVEILNRIVVIMDASADSGYSKMECEFDYESGGGVWSVDTNFVYYKDGIRVSEYLNDPQNESAHLVRKLRDLMREHSGGEWNSFHLAVAEDGKATTKFRY